jgi:HEAT repeat protein
MDELSAAGYEVASIADLRSSGVRYGAAVPVLVRWLIELLDDPVVNGHAVKALRKLKVPAARAGLQRMLADERRGCARRRSALNGVGLNRRAR